MQSSVSSRFPGIVSLRSRLRGRTAATTRRIGSLSRLHQPPIFRSEHDTTTTATATTSCSVRDHHRNHVDRRRPFRIRFSAQTHQQQRQQQQPPRRIHSTLASKSFWRGLHQAVRQGNGSQAEEIAEQVLQDYYRLALLSSSSSQQQQQQSDLIDGSFDAGMDSDRQLCFDDAAASFGNSNNKYNESIAEVPPLLDSQIFSLVLQAWKNSDCPSLHSALRAHNLLIQMAALADQDVLCDPPVLDDYLAVLECWHQASSPNEHDEQQQQRQQQQQPKGGSGKNGSVELVLQHAEELWHQMKERQRREAMTNRVTRFAVNEKAYELFASLLAKAGKAARAEEVVEEALAAARQRQPGRRVRSNYAFPSPPALPGRDLDRSAATTKTRSHQTGCEDATRPVGLDLCHAVLEAHLLSKESRAPERAEEFLQKMRKDPSLPNPSVRSYNLVLERWLAFSKASRKIGVAKTAAGKAEALIHKMKDEDRVQANLASYQCAIDAIARSGDAIRAEAMLANLVKDYFLQYDADLKPSIAPFQSVLWAYSKAASAPKKSAGFNPADAAERAESVLNNMKELSGLLDVYPTVWSYNIVMKCWAHSRSRDAADRAVALYEELLPQPMSSSSSSSGELENSNQSEDTVDSFLDPPTDLGPDATSMNTVLNVLSTNEGAVRTEQKLVEFYDAHAREPERCPSPDTIAFSTAINAWSNSSDPNAPHNAEALLRKLIELYETTKRNTHKPDIITYTSVMQCWVKSKQKEAPERVESMLRGLQDMHHNGNNPGMKPDAACWNSAIAAWAAAGNGERAEALFLEMVHGGASGSGAAAPTAITLTNVLKAWARTRSPEASDRALSLLESMEGWHRNGRLAAKPNVVTYSVVLDCLAYARRPEKAERAERMLFEMLSADDPNVRPSVVSYNCVIKAWSYSGDPGSAARVTALLRDLIDRAESDPGMRPNENTFGTILKFLADGDLPDKAKRAGAIENLMNIFLERAPKPWIRKELRRCLSPPRASGAGTGPVPKNNSDNRTAGFAGAGTQHHHHHDGAETTSATRTTTTTGAASCREKRANKRFHAELASRNLARKPITGKPESGCYRNNNCDERNNLREALVRVRLVGKTTTTPVDDESGGFGNQAFSVVVVDGDDEYSCKIIHADKTLAEPELKGGRFLDISYYWHRGEPVIVGMRDAFTGIEIKT